VDFLSGLIEQAYRIANADPLAGLRFLDRISQFASESPAFLVARAELLYQAGEWRASQRQLAELPLSEQVSARVRLLAYRLSGRTVASRNVAFCFGAIAADPTLTAAYNDLGHSLIDQDPVRAEELLQRAALLSPDLAEPCHNLAVLAERRKDWPLARTLYRMALERDPALADARLGLGIALRSQGEEYQSFQLFAGALFLQPGNSQAMIALGIRCYQRMDFQGAEKWYRRALSINPANNDALFNLLCFLLFHGSTEEPIQLATKITVPRLRGLSMINLADLELERDNPVIALHYVHQALQACSDNTVILCRSADVFQRNKLYSAASSLLERCLALAPDASAEWYNLGAVFHLNGAPGRAARAIRNSLRLIPDHVRLLRSAALQFLNLGNLAAAEGCSWRALALDPTDHIPYTILAAVSVKRFAPRPAAHWALRALRIKPDSDDALVLLGVAGDYLSDSVLAVHAYRNAIAVNPFNLKGYFKLALRLRLSGKRAQAEQLARRVLTCDPRYAPGFMLLGALLKERGDHNQAIACFQQAAEVGSPTVELHNGLGSAYFEAEKYVAASEEFRKAVALDPASTVSHYNLGCALQAAGSPDLAMTAYQTALALDPHHLSARFNLAWVLQMRGFADKAEALYADCLRLDPAHAKAIVNFIETVKDQHREELVIRWYGRLTALHGSDQFLADVYQPEFIAMTPRAAGSVSGTANDLLAPEYFRPERKEANIVAAARWNTGLSALAIGRLQEGWEGYESRWDIPGRRARLFRKPQWDGRSIIAGQTLLLWREQGIGDEIMFANCIPDLCESGARIVIEASAKLVKLFARSFPKATVIPWNADDDLRRDDFDLTLPFGSLPRSYRQSVDSFPRAAGFLKPDPDRVVYWRGRLANLGPPPYVGLSWRGRVRTMVRDQFYSSITDWDPILATRVGTFINMQYDEAADEVTYIQDALDVKVHTLSGIDMWDDLDDVAALMEALDLLICSGTAVFSLAAGVGRPVWLMWLNDIENWPVLGTDALPWYPSVRLFPKAPDESWLKSTQQIADALDAWKIDFNESLATATGPVR
jgi:tetratricopeptide (TPR) repeat protein